MSAQSVTQSRSWVWRDGEWLEGASVPVTDRAFRYGMSVFETLAVYRKRLLFLAAHCSRLFRHGGAIPGMEKALAALAESLPDGVLRVYRTAGSGGLTDDFDGRGVFGIFENLAMPDEAVRERGYRVGLSHAPLPCILGGAKTGNYWANVQMFCEARNRGWDEALAVNAQGALVSASFANVFLKVDGIWRTPSASCGARDGVVREWVCRQMNVQEMPISVDELARAEECFLTNSRVGILRVSEIDGRRVPERGETGGCAALYRNEILGA